MSNKTLYDKLWDAHRVREDKNGTGGDLAAGL